MSKPRLSNKYCDEGFVTENLGHIIKLNLNFLCSSLLQVDEYSRRKEMSVEEVERWLAPILGYHNDVQIRAPDCPVIHTGSYCGCSHRDSLTSHRMSSTFVKVHQVCHFVLYHLEWITVGGFWRGFLCHQVIFSLGLSILKYYFPFP